MMRRSCAAALVLVASCARCAGPKSAGSAEELLPQGASGTILTAPLSALAQHVAALADRVAQLPAAEDLARVRSGLPQQLGFDPFSRDGLLAAGLDPDRGAAAALRIPSSGRGSWVAALPLTRPDLFLQTFDRLARERAGYATRTDEARGELRIAVYARDRGKLAVAVVRGYGVVARGDDPAADVAAAGGRKPEETLARDAGLKSARDKLGAQDVIVFAPRGSPIPRRFIPQPLPGDAAVGLGASAQGLSARLVASLDPADGKRAQATLPGGGASLVELLPGDAPLRMRLGLSPRELYGELQRTGQFAELLRKLPAGADLFAALQPGAVISVALRPQANLGAAIDSGFDFRRKSPFDTLQLVALARVNDAAAARKAVAELARQMPRIGARATQKGDDVTVTYPAGEGVRFGIRELEGASLAYLLGGGIAPEDLRRVPKPATLDSAALYADQGAAVFIDFGKLAETVRALPEGAYGTGPQSYVARSVVSQIVEPLRAVKIEAGAVAAESGVTADLAVGLAKP